MKIICDKCHKEMTEFGAILWSPPEFWPLQWHYPKCDKFHICVKCYEKLMDFMSRK